MLAAPYEERTMLASENRKSLMFGIPGIVLQLAGNFMMPSVDQAGASGAALLGLCVALLGTALLIVGLGFYAKGKGHHFAWGLMGLLSIIGIIVLAILPDRNK
jgi:hypothetical protein